MDVPGCYRTDGRIVGMIFAVRANLFLRAKRVALSIRPIGGGYPGIVGVNNTLMRTIVGHELDLFASGEYLIEFEDVAHSCTAKTIQRLVFIANNEKIIAA